MTTINRRGLLAGVAGLGALLATSACSVESADGDGSGEAPKKGTIGISMPTKSSERWVYDGDNLVKEFTALGYTTDLQFAEDVIETQVSQVENMITKGVQALLIAAVDNKAFTAVLQQAKDAKIAVIAYDRLIRETENVDYYVTFDNLKVGVLQRS